MQSRFLPSAEEQSLSAAMPAVLLLLIIPSAVVMALFVIGVGLRGLFHAGARSPASSP